MDDMEVLFPGDGDYLDGDNSGDVFEVTSCKGVKYAIDGVKYRLLSNGAVFDISKSKIVAITEQGLRFKNKVNASEASLKRWDDYRAAAVVGLTAAGGQGGSTGAWAAIIKAQAILAQDVGAGMASTVAAKMVGNAIGALDERGKLASDSQNSDLAGLLGGLGVDRLQILIGISAEIDESKV